MRNRSVVLVAAAALFSVAMSVAPVGAASGMSCKTAKGNASFSPALPRSSDPHKVHAAFSMSGKIGGCVGAGVTSGSMSFKSPRSQGGLNCKAWLTYNPPSNRTVGTETITWNNGRKSTVSVTLRPVKGKPTRRIVSGTVSAGAFKGYRQAGTVNFTLPRNACKTAGLATMTYQHVAPMTFRAPIAPPP